jgi:hypothetical protein
VGTVAATVAATVCAGVGAVACVFAILVVYLLVFAALALLPAAAPIMHILAMGWHVIFAWQACTTRMANMRLG